MLYADAYLCRKTNFHKEKFDLKWNTSHEGFLFELYFAIRKIRYRREGCGRFNLEEIRKVFIPTKVSIYRSRSFSTSYLLASSPPVVGAQVHLRNGGIHRVARFAGNYTKCPSNTEGGCSLNKRMEVNEVKGMSERELEGRNELSLIAVLSLRYRKRLAHFTPDCARKWERL